MYKAAYFADMTINVYYTIMSVYGWYNWSAIKNKIPLKISKTTKNEKFIGFLIFIGTILITNTVYIFFDYKLEIPNYIDIFTSGVFFTAMWYMALKKIESWILWIIGNSLVIPLFAYRGLGLIALQYVIFTLMAVMAYKEWKKNIQQKSVY
jgi:nicotinamide mononucleotide transporter